MLDEKHLFTNLIMKSLDKLFKNVLKYRNTLPLLTDQMSLRESILGTTHDDTRRSMNNLRELYRKMGGDDEQMWLRTPQENDSNKRSLSTDIFNHVVPPQLAEVESEGEFLKLTNHGNIIDEVIRMEDLSPLAMLNNLAFLLMKLGNYDEALPLFTNCLAMREEVLGNKHPDTLQSIYNLAELYNCKKRHYDALPLYQKYASLLEKRFGNKHPYCLEINRKIAILCHNVGENDKALSISQGLIYDDSSHWRKDEKQDSCITRLIQCNSSLNSDVHWRTTYTVKSSFAALRYGFKYILLASSERPRHNSYVNAVCSTGKYIVSASDDKILLVWEIKRYKIEFRYEIHAHAGPIVCLHVMKDKKKSILDQILSASHDGTIKHWDLEEGICLQSIAYNDYSINECLTVICNEKYIFKGLRNRNVSIKKGLIHIFDIKRGGLLFELAGHTDYVRCFAMTSSYLFSGSLDMSIIRWDIDSIGRVFSRENCFTLLGHTDWVRSLCCTKDELRLISGSNDMTVRIWDIETGETIQILSGLDRGVRCVCMSSDDKHIICGAEDNTVRTWDLETGCPIRILRGHTDWVTSVCGIPGTDIIVSCSSDKDVILWDVQSSPNILSLPHTNKENMIYPVLKLCQFNDKLLITCTKDQIYVWDAQQQYENISTWVFSDIMGAEISCICENKTNKSLIICCTYKSRRTSTVIEWFSNDPDRKSMKARDFRGIINCVCFCASYLILGFTEENAILIKDCISEQTIHFDDIPLTIDCVAGDSINSPIYIIIGSRSKDVFIWSKNHRHFTQCFVPTGHTYPVRCLTHCVVRKNSMNHNYIISGSDDYTVKLWCIPRNDNRSKVIAINAENSFEGHTLSVLSVLSTSDLIISGSADKTIMIWSLNGRNPLRTLIGHTSDVTGLHISVANHLISISKDGTLKVWDLSVGNNVPSDVELQELIRVRYRKHGNPEHVMVIIKSMATENSMSENRSIFEDN